MAVRVPYQRRLGLRGKPKTQTIRPGPPPQVQPQPRPQQMRLPFPEPQQLPLPLQSAFGGGPGVRVSGLPAPIAALMEGGLAPVPAHGPLAALESAGELMPRRSMPPMNMGEVVDGEVVSRSAPSWLKRLAAVAAIGAPAAAGLTMLGGDAGEQDEPRPALMPSHGAAPAAAVARTPRSPRGQPAAADPDAELAQAPQQFEPDPRLFADLFGQPSLESQLQQTEPVEMMVRRLLQQQR